MGSLKAFLYHLIRLTPHTHYLRSFDTHISTGIFFRSLGVVKLPVRRNISEYENSLKFKNEISEWASGSEREEVEEREDHPNSCDLC